MHRIYVSAYFMHIREARMAKVRVNLRLSEEAVEILDELCKKQMRDRSNMVEVLILLGDQQTSRSQLEQEEKSAQQG